MADMVSMTAQGVTEPDRTLLSRYVDTGDRQALESLCHRHLEVSYRCALRLVGSHDAADAVQTAFMQVMANAASYRGRSQRAYLDSEPGSESLPHDRTFRTTTAQL